MIKKKKNLIRIGIVITVILISLLLIASQVILIRENSKRTIPLNATQTGEGSYTIATKKKDQVQFVSPKLGITFLIVLPHTDPNTIKEVGNRVYIYNPQNGPYTDVTNGKMVEVFTKDPKDNLITAMKKTILDSSDESSCLVKITQGNSKNMEYATITVPPNKITPEDPLGLTASRKCPAPYTQLNDVRYFAMDKNHPERFFFFNIGQWNYLSGEAGLPGWQDTIQSY